jgi:hypothetical protein
MARTVTVTALSGASTKFVTFETGSNRRKPSSLDLAILQRIWWMHHLVETLVGHTHHHSTDGVSGSRMAGVVVLTLAFATGEAVAGYAAHTVAFVVIGVLMLVGKL